LAVFARYFSINSVADFAKNVSEYFEQSSLEIKIYYGETKDFFRKNDKPRSDLADQLIELFYRYCLRRGECDACGFAQGDGSLHRLSRIREVYDKY